MKRRDITLGEMQDECKKRNAFCGHMDQCRYHDFCHETVGDKCGWGDKGPRNWNLTDPPRFTEAQMALLRGLWEIGARAVQRGTLGDFRFWTKDFKDEIATVEWEFLLREYDDLALDLAELLGKDGADAKA